MRLGDYLLELVPVCFLRHCDRLLIDIDLKI
jgi:hypothetical protein